MTTAKRIVISITGGVVLFFATMLFLYFWQGSVGAIVSWLGGDSVYIYPKTFDLGYQKSGSHVTATFYIKNLTSKKISVIGEKSSCSCAFSEKLPITAMSKEMVELRVNAVLPEHGDVYDETLILMIANDTRLIMCPIRIKGIVLCSHPSSTTKKGLNLKP